jgi:hypothetical protein
VSTIPFAVADLKTRISEWRVVVVVVVAVILGCQPVRAKRVVGERRGNESRESTVNIRAPTGIVDDQESRWKG